MLKQVLRRSYSFVQTGTGIIMASYSLLNTRIDALQHEQILDYLSLWIRQREKNHYVLFANAHSVMENRSNISFKGAAENADLTVPDGMPLVLIGRLRGMHLPQRADGPGFMLKTLNISTQLGWRHYFYGSTPEILQQLLQRLRTNWPGVQIAGSYAPPFRPLTAAEEEDVISNINKSGADILWIGLGCPKQEIWMWRNRDRLQVPVMLGVGQAFDLMAGVKNRAPGWMRAAGLEWAFRLVTEPRRTWRRYLINNPLFIWLVLMEEIRLKINKPGTV